MTSPNTQEAREICYYGDSTHHSLLEKSGLCSICNSIALALQKAEARGRLFNVGLEQENRIHDLELKLAGLYGYADIQGMEFVKHIKAHLKDGQEVICKICGKTVEQIALEAVE